MKKGAFVLGLFVLFTCKASADVSVAILKGEAVGENKAALAVSAADDAGRPLKGLSQDNFELTVGGERIYDFSVEPTSLSEEPLSIILGVDVSGSMWGVPFKATQKAISIFLDQLEKADFVSLMSFGSTVVFVTDFTRERYSIRTQVDALRPVDDWTHLYDAAYAAIKKARDAPTTRTAVILLTDGRDEGSKRNSGEAVSLARGASVPVFTIGFGANIDRAYLQEIAKVSGGSFDFTPEAVKIPELYQGVLDHLKNQYMIRFDFAKAPSTYKANLTLVRGTETAKSSKEFLFNPTGGVVMLPPQPVRPSDPLQRPWHVNMTSRQLIFMGSVVLFGLIVLIVILSVVYFKVRKRRITREREEREERDKRDKHIMEMLESTGSQDCELEYPTEYHTAVQDFESRSSQMTRISQATPDVLLQVNGMKRAIPLVHEGVEVLEELIIAKKSKERLPFRKPGTIYLWTKNEFVSRPSKESVGHARLFLGEGERFMIEDLGSTNGTWIGGKKIDGTFPLQDGDTLDVGGKEGIRIVYKEGRQEIKEIEQTMISR